jgi:MFS family permease
MRTPKRSWIRADLVRLLAATSAWGFAHSSFALLPKFLARELHAGAGVIGIVMGIFGIATFLAAPLAGRCVDRFSHRQTILAGGVLMGLSSLGFLVVDSVGIGIAALRVMQAVSYALVFTALGAAVPDLSPPERLSQALGLAGASTLVMNAIAPAVIEPLTAIAGWKAAFVLAAASAALSVVLAARIGDSWRSPASPLETRIGILALLRRPVALHYAMVIAVSGLVFGSIFAFQPPFALELGRERVRGFFVAFAVAAILVRLFFGDVPDRFGRHRVATLSLALYALGTFALAILHPLLHEVLGVLFGFAHGLFFPSLNAIAVSAVAPHERGRMMAIFTGAFSLGVGGTTLLGLVAEGLGYAPVFVLVGAAGAAGAVVLAGSAELRAAGTREPLPEIVEASIPEPGASC